MVSRLPLSAGFRMKEILLDLAEVTAGERPEIDEQLVDFGVVGPGPRRALNFVNNRRWFDNEYDRSPQVFLWGWEVTPRGGPGPRARLLACETSARPRSCTWTSCAPSAPTCRATRPSQS